MSKNIEVYTAVHGIAPRSDDLLKLGGDLRRGRVSQEHYDEQVDAETQAWLEVQQEAGITWREDGKLDWQDLWRPVVKATEGFSPGIDDAPVTRWPRTNTFFREPTITGDELVLDTEAFGDLISSERELGYLSLLAPHTFAHHFSDESGRDDSELVLGLYDQILQYAQGAQIGRVTLTEYAPTSLEGTFWQSPIASIEELAERFPDINIGYVQLGQAAKTKAIPLNAPENLGVTGSQEAFNNLAASASTPFLSQDANGEPREYWLPIVSGDKTIKDEIDFSPAIGDSLRAIGAERVVLTHNTRLELLPLTYAQRKVNELAEVAEQLREKIGA